VDLTKEIDTKGALSCSQSTYNNSFLVDKKGEDIIWLPCDHIFKGSFLGQKRGRCYIGPRGDTPNEQS
jgi:hypothetical protein